MTVTRDKLAKKHGEKADALFAEIARLGGWGEVGPAENQLDPGSTLDVGGVLDADNGAVSAEAKKRIKDILGGGEPKADEKK